MLVPEVVQTSAMDCGPATLKSLLDGFGIPTSYDRLRQACQTDVDGTSIDTMEEVARALGLEAEQVVLPVDHVLRPEARALPAIVVVRAPNGLTHFVLLWRCHGGFVQIMDPAGGRRWLSQRRFLSDLFVHGARVPAGAWREWAASEESVATLGGRLAELGLAARSVRGAIDRALADPEWRSLAALDAATRMISSIVRSRGLRPGAEASRVLETVLAGEQPDDRRIPAAYWSVRPVPDATPDDPELLLQGAVLVRVRGRQPAGGRHTEKPSAPGTVGALMTPERLAALKESARPPFAELLGFLRADGLLAPTALIGALGLASGAVLVQALLFRGLFDLGRQLGLSGQRAGAITALLLFVLALLVLELQVVTATLRMGRKLEARLRKALLEKIPRLGDRYFQSRLSSDLAERSHSVHKLRLLPHLGSGMVRTFFELAATTLGIVWLAPASAPLALLTAAVAVAVPLLAQSLLAERDLRVRTHTGALGRFYLDSLLGLVPIRAHGAEGAMRREHESLLVEWKRASLSLLSAVASLEAVQAAGGFGFAAWLLLAHLSEGGGPGLALLLAYWALNLPVLGEELAALAWQYPSHRSVTLRLFEPLTAREEAEDEPAAPRSIDPEAPPSAEARGVAIRFQRVSVRVAGHTVLEDVDLGIEAGSHVAIVGPSGAGKSTLVGLLLGWQPPASGRISVGGRVLDGRGLRQLREYTAWVDPAVQLWNRPLLDNLLYGLAPDARVSLDRVIDQADLVRLLEQLGEGWQTRLGEGGGLVSGGEGQRIRLARALVRPSVRLAILDEPFRGLDRDRRRALLARARSHWRQATLLCVTHDVGDTVAFDRVVVIEAGRIREDGRPAELLARPGSRYRGLLDAEAAVGRGVWTSAAWRRLWLEDGRLAEAPRRAEDTCTASID
jgi:ATP-binding cassette subfamily B protein